MRCVARRSGQDWPKATAVRRLGLDRFEHGVILIWTGSYYWSARSILCGAVAPGASTYIRQLRYGLPQSCMHGTG